MSSLLRLWRPLSSVSIARVARYPAIQRPPLHHDFSIIRGPPIRTQLLLHRWKHTAPGTSPKHMVFKDLNYIDKKPVANPAAPTPRSPPPAPQPTITQKAAHTALVTKEMLLANATSAYERLAISTKWALIKSYRPFNVDEISAFFSWFILSHILWIILGTTTFFSLLFLGLNSLFTRELVGNMMGRFIMWLNPSFKIQFEDAVVPEWREGMIDFKGVKLQTVDDEGMKLDLAFDSIKLTLNFTKWKNLQGIVEHVEVQGLTGVIDRRNINQDTPEVDWFDNKNYVIESVKVMDSMVHIYQPGSDEPLKVALYNCELPKIRVNWLLLDCMNAVDVSGSMNGSLFTIHKRQHQLAYVTDIEDDINPWKNIMRYRLDDIEISSLGLNSSVFNWLTDGKMEIMADIMPPAADDDEEFQDRASKYVVLDFKLQLHDAKAKLPLSPPTLSDGQPIITLDELRPIISYVNNKRMDPENPLPPLCFRIVKRVDELENVTTLRESKLPDAIATEIYIDLMKHVQEYQIEQRNQRIATWSNIIASQLLVVGLGAMA